jgi:hypothetical protein
VQGVAERCCMTSDQAQSTEVRLSSRCETRGEELGTNKRGWQAYLLRFRMADVTRLRKPWPLKMLYPLSPVVVERATDAVLNSGWRDSSCSGAMHLWHRQ